MERHSHIVGHEMRDVLREKEIESPRFPSCGWRDHVTTRETPT